MQFATDRRTRLSEVTKGFAPHDSFSNGAFADQFLMRTNEMSIFGCNEKMVHVGIEKNGLGNERYLWQGTRDIIAVRFEGLQCIGKQTNVTIAANEDVPSFMKRLLGCMEPTDATVQGMTDNVFYHRQEPNEIVVIPAGFGTIERSIFS